MHDDTISLLRGLVHQRADKMSAEAEQFRAELLEKIEEAKEGEILRVLGELSERVRWIEDKLKESDKDKEEAMEADDD